MNVEDLEAVEALIAYLVEVEPTAFSELTPEQEDAFRLLMPLPKFDADQRHFLARLWLQVTSEQIDDINASMPAGRRVSGVAYDEEQLFLGADLLTDALDGRSLSSILHIIETLPLTYIKPEKWPQPDSEE